MQGDSNKKITDEIVINSWARHADPSYYGVRTRSIGSTMQALTDSLDGGNGPIWGRKHSCAGADGVGEDDRCWM